jgi:hypothetical protein
MYSITPKCIAEIVEQFGGSCISILSMQLCAKDCYRCECWIPSTDSECTIQKNDVLSLERACRQYVQVYFDYANDPFRWLPRSSQKISTVQS